MYLAKSIFLFIALIISFGLFSKEKPNQWAMGFLKKGTPADTIREYYESGALKSLHIPFKKTYKYRGIKYHYCLYIVYDENGNQKRHVDDRIGYEQTFTANGDVNSYMIYNRKKSKLIYYIEFFPASTKRMVISRGNKYDFDEYERLRRHWVRKSVRYDKRFDTMIASFYFEEFDVFGEVSKSGRFYTNLNEHNQWVQINPEFPTALDSVHIQDFKEIIFPQLNEKEVYKWDYTENKTIISRFDQQGDSWTKILRRTFPRHPKKNGYGF